MTKPRIYLAGAIYGATGAEANDWRADMTARLEPHGIGCISPLRCEPVVGDRYDTSYADPCFGTPEAIVAKNFLDLRACDLTLVYLPTPPGVAELRGVIDRMKNFAEIVRGMVGAFDGEELSTDADVATMERLAVMSPQRSIGTIGELSWAYALQKPVALVSDDPLINRHPFTTVQPGWRLSNLAEAERLIVGLFKDYVS